MGAFDDVRQDAGDSHSLVARKAPNLIAITPI
jgi:hypothetical protein